MNVLMDTPAGGLATRLSKPANSILADADNTILVLAAVAWEVAIKASLGKLIALPLVMDLSNRIIEESFCGGSYKLGSGNQGGSAAMHHRDRFDRLLIAHAQALNVPILSADAFLDRYDLGRLW